VAVADDLARKAFRSKGQLQFDLYVNGAVANREADKLSAQAELSSAGRSIEESRLKIVSTRLANLDEQISLAKDSIANYQVRAQKTQQLAADAAARRDTQATAFETALKEMAAAQENGVDLVFDAANEQYTLSIEQLEMAMGAAPSSSRPSVQFAVSSGKAEYAQVLHQQAIVHLAYNDMLRSVATSLTGDNQRAQMVNEVADAATTRADAARQKAGELYTAALADLEGPAESGDLQEASLRSLIQIQQGIATLAGEAGSRDTQIAALRSRLKEATQQAEATVAAPAPVADDTTPAAAGGTPAPAPAPAGGTPSAAPTPAPRQPATATGQPGQAPPVRTSPQSLTRGIATEASGDPLDSLSDADRATFEKMIADAESDEEREGIRQEMMQAARQAAGDAGRQESNGPN
jgi:hypothetical protein